MAGLSLSLTGLSLSSLAGSGGTPTPTPIAITATYAVGTTTYSTVSGDPAQWQRDFIDIPDAFGPSYVHVSPADDGCLISAGPNSTVIPGVPNDILLNETFATDAVDINAAGWSATAAKYSVADGVAKMLTTSNPGHVWRSVVGNQIDFEFDIKWVSGGATGIYFYSPLRNSATDYISLEIGTIGWAVRRVCTGSAIVYLQNFVAKPSWVAPNYCNNIRGKTRLYLNADGRWYVRIFFGNVEEPLSAAANGGKGYDINPVGSATQLAVPANTNVAFFGLSQGVAPTGAAPWPVMGPALVRTYNKTGLQITSIDNDGPFNPATGFPKTIVNFGFTGDAPTTVQFSCINGASELVADWASFTGSDLTIVGQTGSIAVDILASVQGQNAVLFVRDEGDKAVCAKAEYAMLPITQQMPMQLSLNVGENGYFVDPMKDGMLTIARQGGGREVLSELYEATSLDSQASYAPIAHLAPDANGNPTQWLQASDGYLATDNFGFKWDRFDHWPDYLQGTYDVTFPPGLEWALNGSSRMSRTAYDSLNGTATIVLNDVTGGGSNGFMFTGYNGSKAAFPPSFFFNMVKQGSTETGAIHSAAVAKLQKLVSHGTGGADGTYKGAIRFMKMLSVDRAATAGFAMTGFVKNKPNGSNLRPSATAQITPAEMLEMCTRVGCNMWLNVSDRMPNSEKLALAQYLFANKPAGMTIYLEPSNEMWNDQGAFSQALNAGARATALGIPRHKLYVREFIDGIDATANPTWAGADGGTLTIFQSVFGAANPKLVPVLAWQAATTSASIIADMLNEHDIHAQTVKPAFAIGPYIGGGIGTGDLGNYNEQSIFTKAQRDTALGGGPNYATYLGHFFAAQTVMSGHVRTFWRTFCKNLGDYAQGKGYARTAFMPATYEHQWQHTVESNTPAGTQGDTLAAMVLALRDARAGLAQNAQHDWMMETGGLFCLFNHQSKPTIDALDRYGIWGVCDQMQFDTQEPAASIAAWKIAKGV